MRKSFKFWLWRLIFPLCALFIIALGLFPLFFSTSLGNQLLISTIQKRLGGTITVTEVKFSWAEHQELNDLHYFNPSKGVELGVQKIIINQSPLEFLFGGFTLNKVELINPDLKLTLQPKETRSLQRELQPSKKKRRKSLPSGRYTVSGGNIDIEAPFANPMEFRDVNLKFSMQEGVLETLITNGKTIQNQTGGTFNVQSNYSKQKRGYEIQAQTKHFPVAGLDEFAKTFDLSMYGVFSAIFGDTIDLVASGNLSHMDFHFDVRIDSPRLRTNLSTKYENGWITLSSPAVFDWQVDPKVLSLLRNASKTILNSPTDMRINLTELSIPFIENKVDFTKLKANLRAVFSKIDLSLMGPRSPLVITGLTLFAETADLSDQLFMSAQSSIGSTGSVKMTSVFSQFFSGKAPETTLDLNMTRFPTPLIDSFMQKGGVYTTYLGPEINASVKYIGSASQGDLSLMGETSALSFSPITVRIKEGITLEKPFGFKYRVEPGLLQTDLLALSSRAELTGDISTLYYPLSNNESLSIEGKVNSPSMNFKNISLLGPATFSNMSVDFTYKGITKYRGNASLRFTNPHNPYVEMMGNAFSLEANGTAQTSKEGILELPKLDFIFKGNKVSAEFFSSITGKDFVFSLNKPSSFNFSLTPQIFKKFISDWKLTQPAMASLDIDSLSYSLKSGTYDEAHLNFDSATPELSIQNQEGEKYRAIAPQLKVLFDGKKREISSSFYAKLIDMDGHEGKIDSTIKSTKLDWSKGISIWTGDINAKLKLSQFATSLLEKKLDTLVGPRITLDLDMKKQGEKQTGAIDLTGKNLTLSGEYTLDANAIELTKPAALNLTLTPKGYEYLETYLGNIKMPSTFILASPAKMKADLKLLKFPLKKESETSPIIQLLFPKIDWDIEKMLLKLSATLSELSIRSRRSKETVATMENLSINLKKERMNKPFTFDMKGGVSAGSGKGSVDGLGEIAPDGFTYNGALRNFPSAILDTLSRIGGLTFPPSALFGDTINAKLNTKMLQRTGTLGMNISSTNAKADIDALFVNGRMVLQKPIKASIIPSDALAHALLDNQSLEDVKSRRPIDVYIEDRGFSIPIVPYDARDVQIPNMIINLDRITCKNSGSIQDVGGLFKLKGSHRISLWFAPMDLHIRNGIIDMERTEVLFNNAYQIALWGKILLPQRFVNMVLGLTAQSLQSALGLRNLPSSYVLQIPIKGPFGNVRVYKEEASSKIGMLIAREAGAGLGRSFGGPWGNVIGGVLGKITDDQSGVPPPKPPFPWQMETGEAEKQKTSPPPKISSLRRSFKELKKLTK